MSVPPFLIKTFDLVSEDATDQIVSWSEAGDSFIVWNNPEFSKVVLPKHFKHNNFSSFVRQLNTYGFKKIDPDRWEFMNPNFQRGRVDLLKDIQRRKGHAPSTLVAPGQPAIEVGQFGGLAEEVEALKRDKNVLMMELVGLRQRQQKSDKSMSGMKHRLEHTERRLSQLIAFFSNVASNPTVLAQMVNTAQASQAYLAASETRRKKRRHDGAPEDESDAQTLVAYKQPVDIAGFFQNLMVSPMPEEDAAEEDADGADALEHHFNGINLRNASGGAAGGASRNGVTIREHMSPDGRHWDGAAGSGDDEIQIPAGIAAGVPSVGVPAAASGAPPFTNGAAASADAAAPFTNGAAASAGGAVPFGKGAAANDAALPAFPFSNGDSVAPPLPMMSIALDDLPSMSGDMLDGNELQDILRAGSSLDYVPGDEESWQAMLADMSSGTPPA